MIQTGTLTSEMELTHTGFIWTTPTSESWCNIRAIRKVTSVCFKQLT